MQLVRRFTSKKALIIYLLLVIFLALGCMVAIGAAHPDMADDYSNYNMIRETNGLWGYVHYWYLHWTGRIQNVVILWFSLQNTFAKGLFGLSSPLVLAGLAYLIAFVGQGRKPKLNSGDGILWFATLLTLWLCLPRICETVFWRTGASVYLWSTFFLLLFILPYRLFLVTPSFQPNPLQALGLFLLGLWVGVSHEQLILPLLLLVLGWGIQATKQSDLRKLPLQYSAGIIGYVIGALLLLAAPGNYVRLHSVEHQAGAARFQQIAQFLARIFVENGYLFLCLSILTLILLCARKPTESSDRPFFLWLGVSALSLLPLLFLSSVFAVDRTAFYAVIFLIIAVHSLAPVTLSIDHLLDDRRMLGICLGLALFLLYDAGSNLNNALLLRQQVNHRTQLIAEAKQQGVLDVELPLYSVPSSRAILVSDMTDDPQNWLNLAVARYHHLRSIRLNYQKRME